MQALFYAVAALACPVGMGVMMWLMMRGNRRGDTADAGSQQVAALRAEIDQLKAERAVQQVRGEG
jgi:hypothetical protein